MYKWHKVISKDASVYDTLETIISFINYYSKSDFIQEAVKEFGPTGDKKAYMQRVFDWIRANVDYKEDFPGIETIFTPQLTILFAKADCKKQTILAACLLNGAGITPVLKHVYYAGRSDISHIYTIVPMPDVKHYIAFDTTLRTMGDEVSYKSATLYFLNGKTMEVHTMGGRSSFTSEINAACMGFHDEFSAVGKINFRMPGKVVNTKQALQHLIPNRPGLQEHLNMVPAVQQRGAFLNLIENNVDGIATHLAAVLGTKPDALTQLWQNIGGDINSLKQEIVTAATKPVIHSDITETVSGTIGKFSLRGVLHASAGILRAVAPVAGLIVPGAGAALDGIANKADAIANAMPVRDKNAPGGLVAPPTPAQVPLDPHGHNDIDDGKIFGMPKMVVLAGAAGLALLLIMKK